MGSIVASQIVNDTKKITQDLKNVFWSEIEGLGWLNSGQREICIHRPDAYTVLSNHTCENQATQQIPSNGLRFLEATYNVASGYVIQPIDRSDLDQVQRNWQDPAANATEVEHYIFDERFPKFFKLYPVPAAGVQVEIGYSASPPDAMIDEPISVDDIYANPLMDYMLARMYQKNTTLTNAANKSQQHLQLFYQSLGVKFEADRAVSPNTKANRED
jgi:hypothetical protein